MVHYSYSHYSFTGYSILHTLSYNRNELRFSASHLLHVLRGWILGHYGKYHLAPKRVFSCTGAAPRIACSWVFYLPYLRVQIIIARFLCFQNENILNEIYSTPWYELSSKYRKTIQIFISQTQYPIQLRILNFYPLKMKFVPKILKFVHSNAITLYSCLKIDKN